MLDSKNPRTLVIFVDAYPYHNIAKFEDVLPEGFSYSSLTPTFGFSINQKALLFGGRTPDDCGYFNEWVPRIRSMGLFERICWALSHILPSKAEGLLHKVYSKIYKLDYYRIPFGMKSMWKRNPTEIYNRSSKETSVLTSLGYTRVLYSDFLSERRDEMVFLKIKELFSNDKNIAFPRRVFVTLADCDSQLHRTGGTGYGSGDICNYYAREISSVVNRFLGYYPNGNVVILSDHGMSDVEMGFDVLSILKSIAKPSERTYIYFVDATMLRIWYFDESLREKVRRKLKGYNELLHVNDEMRLKYSIVNKEFGEDIYTLSKDNLMFEPNFYGRKRVDGMHGYIPKFDSQKGIFITKGVDQAKEVHAREVFTMLCDVK